MSIYSGSKPRFLEGLVSAGKLTPDGKDWLKIALDPFHDLEHPAAGFPDADGSQTIVSCYQYQMDVSKPAAAGNWDCHIFTTPVMEAAVNQVATEATSWISVTATADSTTVGPLTIMKGAAGSVLNPGPAIVGVTSTALPPVGVKDLVSGISRVIGMGFEVTNTTAEINKQGAVTCYRMPQFISEPGTEAYTNLAGTQAGTLGTKRYRTPPGLVAQANLLKGTRTWDAASGVYATAVLNTVQNPMLMTTNQVAMMTDNPNSGLGNASVVLTPIANYPTNAFPAFTGFTAYPTQLAPYDTTGAFFTGLSEGTTLTIKFKVFVERAPTHIEPSLCVLATPSAGIDHVALELYSHAINQLPVAVTVSENGLGDWFKGVVNVLRNVVSAGSKVTAVAKDFVPGLGPIHGGIRMLEGAMTHFSKQRNPVSVIKEAMSKPPQKKTNSKRKALKPSLNKK